MLNRYYTLLINKFIHSLEWVLKKLPTFITKKSPELIYKISDKEHDILVYQNLFFRWLNFGGTATQSKVCKYYISAPCLETTKLLSLTATLFKAINPLKQNIDIILLGLGGGDLLRNYVKTLKPIGENTTTITAIERSAAVISVAKKYFYLDKISKLKNIKINLIKEDAFNIILSPVKQQYHIISTDFFTKLDSTISLKDTIYIESLYNKLAHNGILAINILVSSEKNIQKFIKNINSVFGENILIVSSPRLYNTVIFAFKSKTYLDFITDLKNEKTIELYIKDTKYMNQIGYFANFN